MREFALVASQSFGGGAVVIVVIAAIIVIVGLFLLTSTVKILKEYERGSCSAWDGSTKAGPEGPGSSCSSRW